MWYAPYLRVKRFIVVYAQIIAGLTFVALVLRYWPGVVNYGRHGSGFNPMHDSIDVCSVVAASAIFVALIATALGLNLASENDGHLESTWTRPVSRDRYVLELLAVDIVAMIAAIAVTAIAIIIIATAYLNAFPFTLHGQNVLPTLYECVLPLNIYVWIMAITASMKRNRGLVAALYWPALFLIFGLRYVHIPQIRLVGWIADALYRISPMSLFHLAIQVQNDGPASDPMLSPLTVLAGIGITFLLIAATLVQWRRLEA
jgi:ABC-type transport system involved in multi-copper enzyme maturation permease subunit